jgi:hypothetical protein
MMFEWAPRSDFRSRARFCMSRTLVNTDTGVSVDIAVVEAIQAGECG